MDMQEMERLSIPLPQRVTDSDLDALMQEQQAGWRDGLRALKQAGEPTAAFGPFRQMLDGSICLENQTAITGTAETAMFSVARFSGFAANQLRAGQVWHLTAFGILTTAGASPGNLTLTPRFGTSTSGTSLGASAATAFSTSATNVAWRLEYDLIVRRAEGAAATVVGNGHFRTTVAAIAASVGNLIVFGSTASVTVDVTAASGLFIGVTMGSASDTMTTMGVMLESLN